MEKINKLITDTNDAEDSDNKNGSSDVIIINSKTFLMEKKLLNIQNG